MMLCNFSAEANRISAAAANVCAERECGAVQLVFTTGYSNSLGSAGIAKPKLAALTSRLHQSRGKGLERYILALAK
jgi:hypothetical protein